MYETNNMIRDNLKAAIEQSGLRIKEITARAGVSPRLIEGWLANNKTDIKPNVVDFYEVCKVLGVSMESIIDGDEFGHRMIGNKIVPFYKDNTEIVSISFFEVEASAGNGIENYEYPEQTPLPVFKDFLAPYNPDKIKAIKVSGDSMTGMNINDKDIVLFNPSEITGDGVFVISSDTGLRVKKLEFSTTGKRLVIHSANPDYKDEELIGEEINQIRIIGKVIGWIHRHFY